MKTCKLIKSMHEIWQDEVNNATLGEERTELLENYLEVLKGKYNICQTEIVAIINLAVDIACAYQESGFIGGFGCANAISLNTFNVPDYLNNDNE